MNRFLTKNDAERKIIIPSEFYTQNKCSSGIKGRRRHAAMKEAWGCLSRADLP